MRVPTLPLVLVGIQFIHANDQRPLSNITFTLPAATFLWSNDTRTTLK